MTVATWTCNKDSRIANNGSNMGSGTSSGLPYGLYSGYRYRVLLGFPANFTGWTSLNSATLYVRNSNQIHVGFGSSPTMCVRRINTAWSEGTSNGLSTSNAVVYPGPGMPTVNQVIAGPGVAENTWKAINIAGIIQDAMAGNPFYGIEIIAWDGSAESSSSADVGEIYSREAGSAAYIVVDYNTNTIPNAPILTLPGNGSVVTGTLTPTLNFTPDDPQGDACTQYNYQIALDAAFTSVYEDVTVGGPFPNGVAINRTVSNPQSRGVTYYWRVHTADAISGWGPWSWAPSYRINQLPTVSLVQPSGANALIEMSYVAGAGVGPRMVVRWNFSDPDGGAQSKYHVNVVNDAGSAFWDSGLVTSSDNYVVVPVDAVRGNFYKVTVDVQDGAYESASTAQVRCKAQWAVAEYRLDTGGTVTAWSTVASSTGGANKAVVTEYASSAAGGAIGTWFSSLASAAFARWFHWRVFLFAWSGAATPTFDRMALTFTNSAGVPPDGWSVDAQFAIDTSTRVYGTQSLRGTGNGSEHLATQVIPVQKNTDYILSGRIKSDGNSVSRIQIVNALGTLVLAESPVVSGTQEFTRVQTPIWNSGDADTCIVRCQIVGAGGTRAWFDALKMEASRVVTAWTPGFVGAGVSIDAGGIKVDASPKGGATLRLQAGAGTARDTVEVATNPVSGHGLLFGGDVALYSPQAGMLRTDQVLRVGDMVAGAQAADYGAGSIELFGANAYIDFKNDVTHDSDARIIIGSATGYGSKLAFFSAGGIEFVANVDGTGHAWFDGSVSGAGGVYEGASRLIQPAGLRIQSGMAVVPANAGTLNVTFSPAFSGVPTVIVVQASSSRNYAMTTNVATASGFGIIALQYQSGALPIVPTVNLNCSWIAIGPA